MEHISILSRLVSGEKVLCDKCNKGYLVPYNTTSDKAHIFRCTHCENFIHCDPNVVVE